MRCAPGCRFICHNRLRHCHSSGMSDHKDCRATIHQLPSCNEHCIAGQDSLGYLYSALYDPAVKEVRAASHATHVLPALLVLRSKKLNESTQVHIFLELKFWQGAPVDGTAILDECIFTTQDGRLHHRAPAITRILNDNHRVYSAARVICPITEAIMESQHLWAGLSFQGQPYQPRIQVTEVCLACHGTSTTCLYTLSRVNVHGALQCPPADPKPAKCKGRGLCWHVVWWIGFFRTDQGMDKPHAKAWAGRAHPCVCGI